MAVIMSAHESAPTTKDGRFIRGGPKLPGKMPEDFPGVCDIVLRTAVDKTRLGWHGVYRCSIDDPNYVTKDRHGVTPDPAPMNLGEILRFAGYTIQRAPGLEWQEDVVEEVAGMLTVGADAPHDGGEMDHDVRAVVGVEPRDAILKAQVVLRAAGNGDVAVAPRVQGADDVPPEEPGTTVPILPSTAAP